MRTDVHSHILYGVDDGAKNRKESLLMLDAARECGLERIVATPHYIRAWKDRQEARRVFAELAPEAGKRGISLVLGSEFSIREFESDRIGFIKNELCFEDSNALLLELGKYTTLEEAQDAIYPLQRHDISIIIAHPERNVYFQKERDYFKEFLFMGCTLQLSAECLLLPAVNPRRRAAKRMLSAKAYRFIASDAHSAEDYKTFAILKQKYRF
ncbi:MAG: hypothetical protein Q4C04_03520 [Clostridia bacterium]|nr:hypothetical protein [Clostridia bacterium]